MIFAQGDIGVRFGPGEIVIVTALLGAVTAAFVVVGRMLIAAKDAQIDAKEKNFQTALADLKDYRTLAADAAKAAVVALAAKNAAEGRPGIADVVAVVPEKHSPVTQEQIIAAEKATLRAKITAVNLELGEPVRTIEDEDEPILKDGLKPANGTKVKVVVEGEIIPEIPPPNGT